MPDDYDDDEATPEAPASAAKPESSAPDLSSLGIAPDDLGPFLAYIINKHFPRDAADFLAAKNAG